MQASANEEHDNLVGTTLGDRYRILTRIGEGGMGIVYEAEHVVIEKRVALKVLRDDYSSRSEVVQRFRQEAKSASRIGNEHIVDISDFGETPNGQSYFVMEMLHGEDLASLLAREGTVAADRAINIVLQCCRALGAAHDKGIVHRDMKPENVFLTTRSSQPDFVKIVDFGIAKMSDVGGTEEGRKLTKTGMIFGTPEYMSPEQASGKSLDHRVDIYAVGVILYEIIVGRVPFVGDSFMGILTQHMFEPVPALHEVNPHVRCEPRLESVIYHALEKDPNQRFQSMAEFAAAVERVLRPGEGTDEDTFRGPPGPAHPAAIAARSLSRTAASPAEQSPRRSRGVGIAVMAALLLAAGAAAFLLLKPETAAGPPSVVIQDGVVRADPGSPSAPGASEPSGNPAAAPKSTVEAEPVTPKVVEVQVTVSTVPSGAKVRVADRGVVCSPSPCTFSTLRGEPIVVEAQRGRAKASLPTTPGADTELRLELRVPRRGGGAGRKQAGKTKTGNQRRDPRTGDLKIPDVFR